jgi:hypothetical protein
VFIPIYETYLIPLKHIFEKIFSTDFCNFKHYYPQCPGLGLVAKDQSKIISFEILDHKGKIIIQKDIQEDSPGEFSQEINISDQPVGLYFLKITEKFSVYVKKIVII